MADKLVRTIKAISVKQKAEGKIGFLTTEEENHWYNVTADEKALDGLLETTIQKGNVVEFEVENGFPKNFTLKEKAKEGSSGVDDMTTFEDLLTIAHEKFGEVFSIKFEFAKDGNNNPILDMEKKYAVIKAIFEIVEDGNVRVFEAHGDATQENCGDMVKKHFIRMAETRAFARALRWATNNAKAAAEETEDASMPEQEPDESEMAQP